VVYILSNYTLKFKRFTILCILIYHLCLLTYNDYCYFITTFSNAIVMELGFPPYCRHPGASEVVLIRPSYCVSCRRQTEHANPPQLRVLRNGRPAAMSFCFYCHKKRIRLVSFGWFHAKTGNR